MALTIANIFACLDKIPIGQAVLRKVAKRVGGIQAAAVALRVTPSAISQYLDGTLLVPDDVLLRAIDIVLDELPMIINNGSQPFNRTPH
jgi:hypothetical protein